MKKTLFAFPDSGYHTFFYPIAMGRSGSKTGLYAQAKSSEWSSPEGKSWLKGRLGIKAMLDPNGKLVERTGFWVAVDVNTGDLDRGYPVPDLTKRLVRRAAASTGKLVIDDLEQAKLGSYNPYIAINENNLPESMQIDLDVEFKLGGKLGELILEIVFVEEAGDPIPVNLIVDFGNSRTVVMALERTKNADGLTSVCRPILFPKSSSDTEIYDVDTTDLDEVIPNSWFALMESEFKPETTRPLTAAVRPVYKERGLIDRLLNTSRLTRTETVEYAPHQFTRVSPAVIGHAARDALVDFDIDGGGTFFLSSPKRYIWDDEPLGGHGHTHWTMQTQAWRAHALGASDIVPLKGDIYRFMPNAEKKFSLESYLDTANAGPEEMRPNHSRSDSLIWVALAILEQADRQIQSAQWRQGNQPYLRRVLGDVLLTYPAGWTEDEIERLQKKWESARDIFLLSRYESPLERKNEGDIPQIRLALDEAVAPQLAIVFSEMHHMRDIGENWIELYGKGKADEAHVRVMTIDIGGGTTDTSIVEYTDNLPGSGIDLTSRLLFKDSTTIAGDRLIKDIIERVLLPQLGQKFAHDEVQRDLFSDLFIQRAHRDSERSQWSVIARTVFIPAALKWLRNISTVTDDNIADELQTWTPLEAGASKQQIIALNESGRKAGLSKDIWGLKEAVPFDRALMHQTIHEWFSHIATSHARFAALFDCDLAILTGKPSELPQIRDMLEEHLPIDPDRILSAKGYYAGKWLPVTKNGEIADAKLVTALGTAVFNAVEMGSMPGWRITGEVAENSRLENHWGRIAGELKPFSDSDLILKAGTGKGTSRLLSECFIGRARFLDHVLPEQVYQLVTTTGEQILLDVEFRRTKTKSTGRQYNMSSEGLEIVKVHNAQTGKKIPTKNVKLKLCSLPLSEDYWQDSGRFEVRWAKSAS